MRKLMSVALVGLAAFAAVADEGRVDRSWEWSPLGVGIAAPLQLPFTDSSVYGLRFGGFFGRNYDVYGLDAGVGEMTEGEFAGIQASGFNWSSRSVYAVQFGGVANVVHGSFYGVQLGSVNLVFAEPFYGVQVGAIYNGNVSLGGIQLGTVNVDSSYFGGLQAGVLANVVKEDAEGLSVAVVNFMNRFTGLELGFVNAAEECTGVQIGAFNAADRLTGMQFGLLNLVCNDPLLNVPVMPVVNASF